MTRGKNERGRDTDRDMEVVFRCVGLRTAPGLAITPRPASEAPVDVAVALIAGRATRVGELELATPAAGSAVA